MKRWVFGLLLFFVFASQVHALTVSVSTPSASIDQDQELNLNISLSCTNCSDSYFRGVFFETSDNYFGLTQNNAGEWIGTSSDRTKYFKVAKEELVDNAWNGILKMKVEKNNSFYKGPGTYSMKVGRYTSSSGSSATWSDSYYINVTGPSPTQTLAPLDTPTPTNTPSPSPTNAPTSTPTNSPAPTKIPTPTKAPTPTKTPTITEAPISEATTEGEVLSVSNSASPTPEATPSGSLKPAIISFALVGAGFGLITILLLWQKRDLFRSLHRPESDQS